MHVENPLTPTGVEHIPTCWLLERPFLVENPLTPTGVEHSSPMRIRWPTFLVENPLTPTGVEHAFKLAEAFVEFSCGESFDADRR